MQTYKVRYTQSAERDLDAIFHYIAIELFEPAVVANLLSTIDDAIGKLEEMPERYPFVNIHKFQELGYHKMVINKSYIAFYTIDEKQSIVFIERIINARRDWVRLLLL